MIKSSIKLIIGFFSIVFLILLFFACKAMIKNTDSRITTNIAIDVLHAKADSSKVKIATANLTGSPPKFAPPINISQTAAESYFSNLHLLKKDKVKITQQTKDSVLLIIVDALNAKHLGAYGYYRNTSPNTDAIAKEGVLFSNWVSNSSWTRPAFTTMMTGLSKNKHKMEMSEQKLDNKIVTLAEIFKNAGYRTGAFVGNPLVQKQWNFNQGFQVYEDTKKHGDFPRGELLVDNAIKWIGKSSKKPFFCVVFLTDPHTPYDPLFPYQKFLKTVANINDIGKINYIQYPKKEYAKPLEKNQHKAIVAAYDGEVAYADQQIGRLWKYLKKNNKIKNTTLAITADHGEAFGEHNCYQHAYHMWESVLRVPFIMLSPAIVNKNIVNDIPHSHMDLLPTLVSVAGLKIPQNKRGLCAFDYANSKFKNRIIFSQYNAKGVKRQTVRLDNYKLIFHQKVDIDSFKKLDGKRQSDEIQLPTLAFKKSRYELYNLLDDPLEQNNLYTTMKNKPFVVHLKQNLKLRSQALLNKKSNKKLNKKNKTNFENNIPQLSDETLKALKAGGYIQ